jgi:hypothetical protein
MLLLLSLEPYFFYSSKLVVLLLFYLILLEEQFQASNVTITTEFILIDASGTHLENKYM